MMNICIVCGPLSHTRCNDICQECSKLLPIERTIVRCITENVNMYYIRSTMQYLKEETPPYERLDSLMVELHKAVEFRDLGL